MTTSETRPSLPMDRRQQKQPASGNGPFQCTACGGTYTRVDHLARHVRSHLQERPFKCEICSKAFGRPDLLKRHRSCHDGDPDGRRSSKRQYNGTTRVSQACRLCAASKIKCDDQKPCSRCTQRGVTCEYAGDLHEDKTTASSASTSSAARDASVHESSVGGNDTDDTAMDMPPPGNPKDDAAYREECDEREAQALSTPQPRQQQQQQPPHQQPQQIPLPQPVLDPLAHDMSGFLREVMMPAYPPASFMHIDHAATPSGLLDFRVDADFALNDNDYGFLDQLCGDLFTGDMMQPPPPPPPHAEPAFSSPVHVAPPPAATVPTTTTAAAPQYSYRAQIAPQTHSDHAPKRRQPQQQSVALGAEAFRRSTLGIWLPAQQDRADAQMENLSILTDAPGSPDTRISLDRRCLRESLSRTMRDEFLAMILRTCRNEHMSIVVRSFPTAELLGDLIECFFTHHQQQTDAYIHAPTFRPNGQRPEFVGAIVASGATRTDIRSMWKLGYAMQEVVRTTLAGTCEQDNATTRALWMLQAFLCQLQVGLWSGIKRKMEISESHTQVVLTMIRRAGRFQHSPAPAPEPLPHDTGDVLRQKWLAWCEQESYRRMAFQAFICDAQVSVSMQTTPILSCAEMSLSFPAARDLWTAETPEQWKMLCLARASTKPDNPQLSLVDFMQQPSEIPDYYDVPLASLVILFGIWGMISHHLQFVRVTSHRSTAAADAGGAGTHSSSGAAASAGADQQRAAGQQPGAAANTLRHQELLQMLQHVRLSMAESPQPLGPEVNLVLELLHVNLHCNFADLQLFAGKGDVEDARRVLPDLQQWVAGRESRLTVWHAGQVLRAAAAFPVKQLHGFYTVAVYHAGLTLWAYGVISQAKTTATYTSCASTGTSAGTSTGAAAGGAQPGWGDYPVAGGSQNQSSQSSRPGRSQSFSNGSMGSSGSGSGNSNSMVSPPYSSTGLSPSQAQAVCLDGFDSQAVQRFVTLGKGSPCIGLCRRAGAGEPSLWTDGTVVSSLSGGGGGGGSSGGGGGSSSDSPLVPLSDPEAVMGVVVEILETNFATKGSSDMEESLSPLVENLVQLMKGLGRAARNVSN